MRNKPLKQDFLGIYTDSDDEYVNDEDERMIVQQESDAESSGDKEQ